MIRILICDDHEIVRKGLRLTILGEEDMELVGEAVNGIEAIEMTRLLKPDVLLLDIQMPEMDGVEASGLIHKQFPDVRILILTNYSQDDAVYPALKQKVTGYLLKDINGDALLQAIRGAARGEPQLHPEIAQKLMTQATPPENPIDLLTDREKDLLKLIVLGKRNKEIAESLFLSEVTVKGYVSNILQKLHVKDRTQAALTAVRWGLIKQHELPNFSNEE
ncbi:MAG: response regulator transcription factor [Anaerolineaceae bacterium]|nr:response regulator transcription factor [Anaerolineaceae bacterium]